MSTASKTSPRAERMCDFLQPLGYDGIVRLEIGFEIINCNFTDSLDWSR